MHHCEGGCDSDEHAGKDLLAGMSKQFFQSSLAELVLFEKLIQHLV